MSFEILIILNFIEDYHFLLHILIFLIILKFYFMFKFLQSSDQRNPIT